MTTTDKDCRTCDGKGWIPVRDLESGVPSEVKCWTCKGTGKHDPANNYANVAIQPVAHRHIGEQ